MTRRKSRLALALAFGLASAVGLSPGAVRAAGPARGFAYCAPPTPPACVGKDAANEAACDAEVQAFVATVFRYRECLEAESERAVREANDVIETWKCRTGKRDCRP